MDSTAQVPSGNRLTSRTIDILVGGETFHIHEDILQSRSTFFSAALHKTWKEGSTGKIELPDDNPEAVGAYFNWLYFSTIPSKTSDKNREQITGSDINAEFNLLTRAYVFGEKITDDAFCNAIMCALLKQVDEEYSGLRYFPGWPAVKFAYEGTPAGSPLRAFLVEMYSTYGKVQWLELGELAVWNAEFLLDVTKALMAKKTSTPYENAYSEKEKWLKKVD